MQQKMLDKYGHIYLYEVAAKFQFKELHIEEKRNRNSMLHALHDLIGKM